MYGHQKLRIPSTLSLSDLDRLSMISNPFPRSSTVNYQCARNAIANRHQTSLRAREWVESQPVSKARLSGDTASDHLIVYSPSPAHKTDAGSASDWPIIQSLTSRAHRDSGVSTKNCSATSVASPSPREYYPENHLLPKDLPRTATHRNNPPPKAVQREPMTQNYRLLSGLAIKHNDHKASAIPRETKPELGSESERIYRAPLRLSPSQSTLQTHVIEVVDLTASPATRTPADPKSQPKQCQSD
jgi:hypothetical protein